MLIVSGSDDKTIKLWDVGKSRRISNLLGSAVGSRLKFRAWEQIKTLETVNCLKFSRDGRHIITNIGLILVKSMITNTYSLDSGSLEDLRVDNMWTYYKTTPILRLTLDLDPRCYDRRGNRVAIVFSRDLVLSCDIDRRRLQLALNESAHRA